jgi:hypothetical protein
MIYDIRLHSVIHSVHLSLTLLLRCDDAAVHLQPNSATNGYSTPGLGPQFFLLKTNDPLLGLYNQFV